MPNEPISTPDTNTGALDQDAILDALNEDVSNEDKETIDLGGKKESESKKETQSEDEEDDKEIKEDEDKLDELNQEDDEFTFHQVPKRQEILKAFPDLFKKFPGLERSVYREQKYAEIFPTVEDAKEAVENLGAYKELEDELVSGSLHTILARVKEVNPQAFGQIGQNYLGYLKVVDPDAFHNNINEIIKTTLNAAFAAGNSGGDKDLALAAQYLHKYVYGDAKVTGYQKPAPQQPNTEAEQLRQQQLQLQGDRLNQAVQDVDTRAFNLIRSTVETHIDPNGRMSDYIRKNAVNDVIQEVRDAFAADAQFNRHKDRLWKAAIASGYSEESKLAIRNAAKAKARAVLPGIISKIRSQALKGSSRSDEPKNERMISDKPDLGRKSEGERTKTKAQEIPKGMTSFEFLNS